jgi:hypothetical protein
MPDRPVVPSPNTDRVGIAWPELVTQRIKSWGGWPEDVEPILRRWNKRRGLRFGYAPGRSTVNGVVYFMCADCGRFIQSLHYMDAVLSGRPYCEDCLIALARTEAA